MTKEEQKRRRNIMVSNIFTILAVIAGILLVIGIFGEIAQLVGLVMLVLALVWLLVYTIRSTRQMRKIKQDALEKAKDNYRSHRKSTGEIILYSYNYPGQGSQRWTVSNSSIEIFHIDRFASKTIPMSQISSMSSDGTALSFKISGQLPTMIGGTNFSVFDSLRDEKIFYANQDGGFVKEIKDRVSNFSNDQTATPPTPPSAPRPSGSSTVDELAKLRTLLDDGTLTQEEFEHKKRKLLGMD